MPSMTKWNYWHDSSSDSFIFPPNFFSLLLSWPSFGTAYEEQYHIACLTSTACVAWNVKIRISGFSENKKISIEKWTIQKVDWFGWFWLLWKVYFFGWNVMHQRRITLRPILATKLKSKSSILHDFSPNLIQLQLCRRMIVKDRILRLSRTWALDFLKIEINNVLRNLFKCNAHIAVKYDMLSSTFVNWYVDDHQNTVVDFAQFYCANLCQCATLLFVHTIHT